MPSLRVVIDARPLSQAQAGGFKSYVHALVTGLRERADAQASSDSLILYVDRPLDDSVKQQLPANTTVRVLDQSRIKSDLLLFGRQLRQDAPDVVMGTANYLPMGLPRHIPQVVTIHDAMGIKSYPWDVGVPRTLRERFINRYWAFLTRRSAQRARYIVTVSKGSLLEIVGALGTPADKLRTVYNGVPLRQSDPTIRDIDSLLVIESPDPRKNVETAYRALPEVYDRLQRPFRLRIVCNGARAKERARVMMERQMFVNRSVRIEPLAGLSDRALACAYARASVFVWPSRFEGFGLPPLEAMQNGCAVVSSSARVMPEILGDIPIYGDPGRPEDFADGIVRLLSNPAEATARGERGRAHAATYTCRRMADETTSVWHEAGV